MAATNPVLFDPKSKNWIALVSAGAFVILAGFLAPRLVSPPTNDAPTTPKPVATTSSVAAPPAADNSAANPDLSGILGNAVFGVMIVIGVCAGVMWYLRRRRSVAQSAAAPGLMRVLAAVPLPYQCCVFLVEIGDRQMLTGIDAHGIKTVIPLPEPAPVQG